VSVRRRRLLPLALALALAGDAAATPALPVRPARIDDDGRLVTMTTSFPDLFDAALGARLDSGFATHLVVRAYLVREGADRAEALAIRTSRVAYDLWDEVYLVEERDDTGVRTTRVRTRAEAIARVTSVARLPVGEAAWMPPGQRYVVRVVVEVNPVSPEMLARVRRWLTRPQGEHRLGSDGESFFGSLVSIFVNPRIGDAERVLRFETTPFARTAAPAAPAPPAAGGKGAK
jgi:hypothetical protein